MNPLITLWLLVAGSALLLSGVFFMAENYPDVIGNFYFLVGVLGGGYILYNLVHWIIGKCTGKPAEK